MVLQKDRSGASPIIIQQDGARAISGRRAFSLTGPSPSVMMSIDVTPKPTFIPARCDWSAGSHRRSLAEVLADTTPGCDSAAPGQHEAGRASAPDSPHLRSGISARARPRRSRSQQRSSSFAGTDDHAGRVPRPEPARASSTSPEAMSHRPGRDNPRSVRAGPDSWPETWWQAGGPGNIVPLTCWIPASKVRHEESDWDGPRLYAKPAASSAVAPVRAGAAEPSGEIMAKPTDTVNSLAARLSGILA